MSELDIYIYISTYVYIYIDVRSTNKTPKMMVVIEVEKVMN